MAERGGLQKFRGVFSRIAVTKHGIARDEQISPGAHHVADRVQIDATIDFDAERQAALISRIRASVSIFRSEFSDEIVARRIPGSPTSPARDARCPALRRACAPASRD